MKEADVFLGCSAPGVVTQDMVKSMARQPIILALANPEPEIRPELAKEVRPDCIVATGRSDYPNQVNNVLCFPYIFRGALDCGATKITEDMKLACVREIARLAKADISEEVATAYAGQELAFGPDYIIPKPFDTRLILRIAPAVAEAARQSGVASRPIDDLDGYRQNLTRFVYQTGMFMRPIFSAARRASAKRVAFAEGEDERVLRAAQAAVDENLARPILIGRPAVIESRIKRAGLHIRLGANVECVDPEDDPRFRTYWETFHKLMGRRGIAPEGSKAMVRRSNTTIAALMVHLGDADAMLCGLVGRFDSHLRILEHVLGPKPGGPGFATLNALTLDKYTLFVADTSVHEDPDAETLAHIARLAAEEVRRFGLPPRVAFLSHSNFGTSERPSAHKMRVARDLFRQMAPDIECDGEMSGDSALSEDIRRQALPDSTLGGEANLLICPNLDAANILFNVLKMTGANGITVGPILMGAAGQAHILTPSATVRRVVNMTALAVANASSAR
jgi:malate dehydrogenase (oxaloacetate-decarboxylating)(NADP+)